MAAPARSGLSRGIDDGLDVRIGGVFGSAEGRSRRQIDRLIRVLVDAYRPHRVVKQQLAEVAFGLGRLVAIRNGAIRRVRHRKVLVSSRNLQLFQAANLCRDIGAQRGGAVVTGLARGGRVRDHGAG
jgi:hypothetical protein